MNKFELEVVLEKFIEVEASRQKLVSILSRLPCFYGILIDLTCFYQEDGVITQKLGIEVGELPFFRERVSNLLFNLSMRPDLNQEIDRIESLFQDPGLCAGVTQFFHILDLPLTYLRPDIIKAILGELPLLPYSSYLALWVLYFGRTTESIDPDDVLRKLNCSEEVLREDLLKALEQLQGIEPLKSILTEETLQDRTDLIQRERQFYENSRVALVEREKREKRLARTSRRKKGVEMRRAEKNRRERLKRRKKSLERQAALKEERLAEIESDIPHIRALLQVDSFSCYPRVRRFIHYLGIPWLDWNSDFAEGVIDQLPSLKPHEYSIILFVFLSDDSECISLHQAAPEFNCDKYVFCNRVSRAVKKLKSAPAIKAYFERTNDQNRMYKIYSERQA